jgi:hypothetical protein
VAVALAGSLSAQCNVDQQQTSFNTSAGGDRWQSFRPAVSGDLCQIDVSCQNASTGNVLEVHYGEGTGALLHREEGIALNAGVTQVTLCAPVPVTAGNTCTLRLSSTNAWHLQTPGAYAGGRSSVGPNDDFWFRSYVRAVAGVVPACNPDQASAGSNTTAGGDRWQSFTAGVTGWLCQVEVDCQNASTGNTLELHAGEGIAGTPLQRQGGVALGAGATTIPTGARVLVVAGQVYTLRLTSTNAWRLQTPGAYAGGRASTGAGDDFVFRTFVQDCRSDQEVVTFTSSAGGDRWQSFTAGLAGELCRVEINCQNPSTGNTFEVYAGEGTGGTRHHQQTGVALSAGVTAVELTAPVTVLLGSVYTIRFTSTNAWRLQIPGSYAGGRASCCANDDFWFRTHVRPACPTAGRGHFCGSLRLDCDGPPILGNTLCLTFPSSSGIGLLVIGPWPGLNPPIPLGLPAFCRIGYVHPAVPLAVLPTGGPVCIPLPPNPALAGALFLVQGFALQTAPCYLATDAVLVRLRL